MSCEYSIGSLGEREKENLRELRMQISSTWNCCAFWKRLGYIRERMITGNKSHRNMNSEKRQRELKKTNFLFFSEAAGGTKTAESLLLFGHDASGDVGPICIIGKAKDSVGRSLRLMVLALLPFCWTRGGENECRKAAEQGLIWWRLNNNKRRGVGRRYKKGCRLRSPIQCLLLEFSGGGSLRKKNLVPFFESSSPAASASVFYSFQFRIQESQMKFPPFPNRFFNLRTNGIKDKEFKFRQLRAFV